MASRPGYGPPNPSGNPPNPFTQQQAGYPPEQGPYRGPASANSSQVPLTTYDHSPSYDALCSCFTYQTVNRSSPHLFPYSSRTRFGIRPPLQPAVFRLRRLPYEWHQRQPAWSLCRYTRILCTISRMVFRTPDTHLHGGDRRYIPRPYPQIWVSERFYAQYGQPSHATVPPFAHPQFSPSSSIS